MCIRAVRPYPKICCFGRLIQKDFPDLILLFHLSKQLWGLTAGYQLGGLKLNYKKL